MAQKIRIIGVPMDLGQSRRGVDMGPSALRVAGLQTRLKSLGHTVEDIGNLNVRQPEEQPYGEKRAKYLTEIAEACRGLAEITERTLTEGYFPLVLGGDHSIAVGSFSGVSNFFRAQSKRVGYLWLDAHGDMNTPDSSPSGNIHGMPLAVALGLGPPALVNLAGFSPMVEGSRAALVGIRDVDPAERTNVKALGVGAFTMRDIDERGMRAVMEEAIARASRDTAGIHVSFDLDGIDPDFAPGVGTPSPGGLSYREAHLAMEMLADSGKVLSAELVEVNPILDNQNVTARLGVGLLASLLGKKIL
ncbi:MAG TPA: arginase [Vicinamibacteria bacterium]|nr:arginase [Vicinamibacteria bacterium]